MNIMDSSLYKDFRQDITDIIDEAEGRYLDVQNNSPEKVTQEFQQEFALYIHNLLFAEHLIMDCISGLESLLQEVEASDNG